MDEEKRDRWDDLLRRTKAGDLEAQNEFYNKLAVTLRPFLESRLRGYPREDKEDVLQEILVVFGQKLNSIRDNPHKYGMKILRNKIGHALRRHNPDRRLSIDDAQISPALKQAIELGLSRFGSEHDLLDELTKREEIERIQKAIENLPDFCRNFFVGILEGRNRKELWRFFKASFPELNRGTYRKRIYDCRRRLIELLGV